MSASREKKKRQNQEVVSPVVEETASKKTMNKTLKKALIIAVSIVLVVAIVFLSLISSGFFAKHSTAVVIGSHKLSPAMVNYFYYSTYSNMSDMLSYLIDTSIPLEDQPYMNDSYDTWADYILDQALTSAAEMYTTYDAAMEASFELSEESKATITNNLQSYELYASIYGYPNGDAMIASEFGVGCNLKTYEEYMTVSLVASEYVNGYNDSLTYTDEEIAAHYAENTEDFDAASFRVYYFAVDDNHDLETLKETASNITTAAQGSELTFISEVMAALPEDQQSTDVSNTTLRSDYTKSACEDIYADWVFDAARQPGDTTYFVDGEEGVYVMYFVGNTDNSYRLPNVRHILVSVADTTNQNEMNDALVSAEGLLLEFEEGEQTEEAFAALADEHSDDGGSEGGLYTNIVRGQMVQSFETWAYDANRQVGDVEVIQSEYGYHVMYFSGYGDTYQDYAVEKAMRDAEFNTWYDALVGEPTYTVKPFFLRFASIQ